MLASELKTMMNGLQYRIDKSSDKVLLIFESEYELKMFDIAQRKKIDRYELPMDYFERLILVTIPGIIWGHELDGIRFYSYRFM